MAYKSQKMAVTITDYGVIYLGADLVKNHLNILKNRHVELYFNKEKRAVALNFARPPTGKSLSVTSHTDGCGASLSGVGFLKRHGISFDSTKRYKVSKKGDYYILYLDRPLKR